MEKLLESNKKLEAKLQALVKGADVSVSPSVAREKTKASSGSLAQVFVRLHTPTWLCVAQSGSRGVRTSAKGPLEEMPQPRWGHLPNLRCDRSFSL